MTPISFSKIFVFALITFCSAAAFAGKPLRNGDVAPDWILPNSQSELISFYRDSEGEPAVVLFWATWCPYCAALMPELEALRKQLPEGTVNFYALNIWEESDPVRYMEQKGFGFTLLLNADDVAKKYRVNGTPGLFVIGADKKVKYVRPKGAKPEDVAASIREVLSVNQ